jgi:urease subunit gamma/beta
MHLTPREIDKLVLHQAGVLAQKRLARGLRLNYVEATALIATQLLEFIRDGRSVSDLMDLGRRLLGQADVLDGVADMIDEVQVEGTFPDGTKLVTVHHPIVAEHGDLALALYGSFLTRAADAGATGRPAIAHEDAIALSRSAAIITSSKRIARCSSIGVPRTACDWTSPPAPPCGSSQGRPRPSRWFRSPAPA